MTRASNSVMLSKSIGTSWRCRHRRCVGGPPVTSLRENARIRCFVPCLSLSNNCDSSSCEKLRPDERTGKGCETHLWETVDVNNPIQKSGVVSGRGYTRFFRGLASGPPAITDKRQAHHQCPSFVDVARL